MLISSSSDQHLGFRRFAGARSPTRQADFYRVFNAWVEETIKSGAGVATLAGDLFDTPDPDNMSLWVAMHGIKRLLDAGIEVIAASGNHDTPLSNRAHIYSVLAELPIHCVYGEEVETVDIRGARFVVVPWFERVLDWNGLPDGDVLVVHTTCAESPAVNKNRNFADLDEIRWKYCALGDWHKRLEVAPNSFYPGSLERTSFGEEDEETGAMFFDLGSEEVTFWDSPSRRMISFEANLEDLSEPMEWIRCILEEEKDSCVRLRLHGYPGLVDVKELDWHPLLKLEFINEGGSASGPQFAPSNLINDWVSYCEEYGLDRAIRRYGRVYLNE